MKKREIFVFLFIIPIILFLISGCYPKEEITHDIRVLNTYKITENIPETKIKINQFSQDGNRRICLWFDRDILIPRGEGLSMYPTALDGSYFISYVYKGDELNIGDIIAFNTTRNGFPAALLHKIIRVGNDEQGRYYITQGENMYNSDNVKVRKENITEIIVAIFR